MLEFDDEVELTIRVASVGRSSITYTWEGLNEGEVAIAGTHTIVHVDANGRPTPVDERTKTLLLS